MRVIGAKKVERDGYDKWWLCVIVHDSELDKYDLTGADVDGMEDDDRIAAGSLIATPTANYIAFQDGIFTQSELAGGGGGGGGGGTAGVNTWNGRTGNVYPRSGDYDAAKISTTTSGKSVQVILDELQVATTLDPDLSTSSTRAVQNKAVAIAIQELRAMTVPAGGYAGDILAKVDGNNYRTEWISGENFMRKSQYDTNKNGRVDKADVAYAVGNSGTYKAELKNINGNTYLLTDKDKAVAGGVVPLDANRKILPEFLPDNIYGGMTYGGIFNATTRVVRLTAQAKSILGVSDDTLTLQNSSTVPEGYPANVELYYVTKTAGTFAGMDFSVGDWLISIGTEWQQLIFGNKVSSVNGQTGAVELDSDQVTQGTYNLYMTPTEKTKLAGIEDQATRDVNVVQTAQVVEELSGDKKLVLTNKNGTVVEFYGGGAADMSEYLKKNGNGSNVYTVYSQAAGSQPAFSGNETEAIWRGKVLAWFDALQAVAFSGSYNDLSDKPTRTSQFTNDGNGNSAYPFITAQVTNLQNYYKKDQTYSKTEIDDIIAALQGMNFVEVAELPTENIDPNTIYLVPKTGGGYTRWWHSTTEGWLDFGDTDVDMTDYLKVDGNGSAVTVTFAQALTKELPETDETLAEIIGKIVAYLADIKDVAFTNKAEDLDDYNDLALKEDLENYVEIQQAVADAGKVMGVDAEGKVKPVSVAAGVMRRGEGTMSMVGNDTEENPVNAAAGANATAIGLGTKASGNQQFANGRYNVEDPSGAYAEITGNGTPTEPANIKTLDWNGNQWVKGEIKVGNTTDNIIVPTAGNSLTPKNYVDETIDTKIAEADLLRSMIVTEVPDVEDAEGNILYLIADPTSEDTYFTYKKVLVSQNPDVYHMAKIGSTQVTSNSTQVQVMPTASVAYDGAVYQYVGSGSDYKFGRFYACKQLNYYAWLSQNTAQTFFTRSATPAKYDHLYRANFSEMSNYVMSVSGNTLTDNAANNYTRLTAQDTTHWEWVELAGKLSEYVNDGTGTGAPNDYFITKEAADTAYNPNLTAGTAITSVADGTKISQVSLSNDKVSDMTALQLFQYVAKKVYPVGAIYISYTSISPATLFGGTWTQISGRFLVASGSAQYSYVNTSGASATGTVNFSATNTGGSPRVQLIENNMPKHNHGLPYRRCGSTTGTDWRTDPGSVDGYGGSTQATGGASYPHGYGVPFDNMPPYLVVYMWRRTA